MPVWILDELWTVYFVPPDFPELWTGKRYTLGVTDGQAQAVYIADDMDYYKAQEVIQHEIAHCFSFTCGMPLDLSEEQLAQFVGMFADDVYLITDWILKWY